MAMPNDMEKIVLTKVRQNNLEAHPTQRFYLGSFDSKDFRMNFRALESLGIQSFDL